MLQQTLKIVHPSGHSLTLNIKRLKSIKNRTNSLTHKTQNQHQQESTKKPRLPTESSLTQNSAADDWQPPLSQKPLNSTLLEKD